MNYIQKTERSLNSLAKEAVRLGRDLSREAHSACVGGNATDFGFVTRSLRRLAERDPFDPQDEALFGALNRILEADLDKEITGTERRFVETYFDHFGQHGEMQDVPVYSDRGEHLLRVRNLLAAFLEARAAALDPDRRRNRPPTADQVVARIAPKRAAGGVSTTGSSHKKIQFPMVAKFLSRSLLSQIRWMSFLPRTPTSFEGKQNMYMTPTGSFRLPAEPSGDRSIKMGVKQHFTGSFITGEEEGHEVEFESHTEFMVGLVMLARPNVVKLENQLLFRWIAEEEDPRHHLFDYRVTLSDRSRIAQVVKKNPKADDRDFRTWLPTLADRAVPDFADRVSLITMRDLDPVEVHNSKLIHGVRCPDPEPDAAVRGVVASIAGPARNSDIAAAAEFPGTGFRALVRMIRSRELELVAHERISPDTLVRRRTA